MAQCNTIATVLRYSSAFVKHIWRRRITHAPIQQLKRKLPLSPVKLLAFLLACSLLVAQWTGLQHRVAHAHLQAGVAHGISDLAGNEEADKQLFHSCLLFDASAMSAGPPCSEYFSALLRYARLPITVLPLVSWQALFIRQFSSRAPPLF